MKKILRLTESDLVDIVKKVITEQNRQLLKRRFIRITNSTGKTFLFDVTEVSTNSEGCEFFGDFRGDYNSIISFLQLPNFKKYYEGEKFAFKFNCSRPSDIELKLNYSSGKGQVFTIEKSAQEVLSKVCKCSRYK